MSLNLIIPKVYSYDFTPFLINKCKTVSKMSIRHICNLICLFKQFLVYDNFFLGIKIW